MAQQVRDLACDACGAEYPGTLCAYREYGDCTACGNPLRYVATWGGANGGLYGSAQYSDATGQWHTSQHEKEMVMAKKGYYPAGDPVGGARKDHTLKNSAFGFSGGPKTSTGERERARSNRVSVTTGT